MVTSLGCLDLLALQCVASSTPVLSLWCGAPMSGRLKLVIGAASYAASMSVCPGKCGLCFVPHLMRSPQLLLGRLASPIRSSLSPLMNERVIRTTHRTAKSYLVEVDSQHTGHKSSTTERRTTTHRETSKQHTTSCKKNIKATRRSSLHQPTWSKRGTSDAS